VRRVGFAGVYGVSENGMIPWVDLGIGRKCILREAAYQAVGCGHGERYKRGCFSAISYWPT
jgi:hypothetical protein